MDEEIRRWAGWDVRFDEEIKEIRLKVKRELSMMYYPRGTVDMDFDENAVVLNEKTAGYLYTEYTPLDLKYKVGSRPFLERVVDMVTQGSETDRDKVFALFKFIRDIQYTAPAGVREGFAGGTEEDIIRKHTGMCNEQARALMVLWQIAGFPARYTGHIRMFGTDLKEPYGHGTNEVYLEGKWCYIDEKGKYFLLADGSIASLWELVQEPEITLNQPDEVYEMLGPGRILERSYRNVHPSTINIIANYFVWEEERHCYQWTWYTREFKEEVARKDKELIKWATDEIKSKGLQTPWKYPTEQYFPDGVVPKKKGRPLTREEKEAVWRMIYPKGNSSFE